MMVETTPDQLFIPSMLLCVVVYLVLPLCLCQETDNNTTISSLRDPNTVSSSRNVFQLGFFSPPNTTNRYLAIYYALSPETVIWIANREKPLNDSSGHFTVAPDGNLLLTNRWNETVWSTNINSTSLRNNTTAQLLNTGNLLLMHTSMGTILWESFSQPLNVRVPTMKLSYNTNTHTKVSLSSWKSPSDPAVGNCTGGIEALPNNIPQIYNRLNGHIFWRSGPWNGQLLNGMEVNKSSVIMQGAAIPQFYEQNGTFYYEVLEGLPFGIAVLNSTCYSTFSMWNDQRRDWDFKFSVPPNECGIYGTCGPFGSCNRSDSPICSCLTGFEPSNPEEWIRGNWTAGCVRRRQLHCSLNNNTRGTDDWFLKLPHVKPMRRDWDVLWTAPQHECEIYGTCGPFGICNRFDSPICSCLTGFEPSNPEEWIRGNWTAGCVRRRQLHCSLNNNTRGTDDWFLKLPHVKVPDFAEHVPSIQPDECMRMCLGNCSCIAYAHDLYTGCMLWHENLIDIMMLTDGFCMDLYIRLSASELDNPRDMMRLLIIIPAVGGFTVLCISILIAWCWIIKIKGNKATDGRQQTFPLNLTTTVKDETEKLNIEELPLFTFEMLAKATDQFDDSNLLGRGGFGPVYKGILQNGIKVAVKRLSVASGQGNEEFMNEVVVISKLQHRNLVMLMGCCAEREEKMLVYEYMPNKSLDRYLFDATHVSQKMLDWQRRANIIGGIGRGLLYLHSDSRLRIIHRDLKPSNVLLDEDWNPKISDFGMARIFGRDEDHDNTRRVVGTYGYMAPEYAMEGQYSEKSDIYSFGVLMLEIMSGKKNTHYYNHVLSSSLLGCAWKMWDENNGLALVDQAIASPSIQGDIVRYIHIALLCVQEFPNDRPSIETALSMLSNEIIDLPMPKEPVVLENPQVGTTHTLSQLDHSINELTITEMDGR